MDMLDVKTMHLVTNYCILTAVAPLSKGILTSFLGTKAVITNRSQRMMSALCCSIMPCLQRLVIENHHIYPEVKLLSAYQQRVFNVA